MPQLRRPGQPEIHFEIDDHTDPWKEAPYIVLQHGFGRSSRLWYRWIPYLSRFFKVVRMDLRGCGKSSDIAVAVGKLKAEDFVGDIVALLDELGAKSVHYCGDSFGGILGMMLAANRPTRIRTLTLLSSPVYLDEHNLKGVSVGHKSWHAALRELGPQRWSEAMHKGALLDDRANPRMAKWFADDMGSSRLETLLAMSELAMCTNVTPLLPKITAPVLALYPTNGTLTSSKQEELLRHGIKNLRFIQLPFPYHMAQHISPAVSADHVLYFAAQFDGTTCRE